MKQKKHCDANCFFRSGPRRGGASRGRRSSMIRASGAIASAMRMNSGMYRGGV